MIAITSNANHNNMGIANLKGMQSVDICND